MRKIIILLCLSMLVFIGCSSNKPIPGAQDKMTLADQFYSQGKYAKAARIYEEISFERRSAQTALAILRMADSYFRLNKFTDARLAYLQLINLFPDHSEVSFAYFRIGVCLFEESLPPQYDQTETAQSIDAFRTFIDRFPNDARFKEAIEYVRKAQYKLIEKKFYNGYLYYKMKDYSAALMYFDEITELGNLDRLDRAALNYTVIIHHRQGNLPEAKRYYERLRSRYPGAKEVRKLAKLFK